MAIQTQSSGIYGEMVNKRSLYTYPSSYQLVQTSGLRSRSHGRSMSTSCSSIPDAEEVPGTLVLQTINCIRDRELLKETVDRCIYKTFEIKLLDCQSWSVRMNQPSATAMP